jgi:hypothetical protein
LMAIAWIAMAAWAAIIAICTISVAFWWRD